MLTFTPFLRFKDVSDFTIVGPLNREWNSSYVQEGLTRGPSAPDGNGSGLKLKRFAVKKCAELLASLPQVESQVEDCWKHVYTENRLIYIVKSERYPVLYVGITEGGLSKGVFGVNGRLAHHVRKIFAIGNGRSTNHTEGWRLYAIRRYRDLVQQDPSETIGIDYTNCADDLQISFGVFDNDAAQPRDHEGFVLCAAFEMLAGTKNSIQIMNTGAMNYLPVTVKFL